MIDAVNAFKQIEERTVNDDWTKEDEEVIRQHYATMGTKIKSILSTKRSKGSIKNKAWRMGIIYKGSDWSEIEKDFLVKNYGVLSTQAIAEKLNRTQDSVSQMAYKLKIKDLYHLWSDEEIEILKKYYPLEGKKVADRLPYKSEDQCLQKINRMRIKYNIEIHRIVPKTSKYKYVFWNKKNQKWTVAFWIRNKTIRFGSFDSEDEAGRVAIEKAKEYGKAI